MVIKSLEKVCGNMKFMRCCNSVCCPVKKPGLLNEIYAEQLQT